MNICFYFKNFHKKHIQVLSLVSELGFINNLVKSKT